MSEAFDNQPRADAVVTPPHPPVTKILVTGATGFVGGYVVGKLLENDYLPVCPVRHPARLMEKFSDQQRERILPIHGDLFDLPALTRAAQDCTAAVHLVGIIDENTAACQTFERIHVEATRNMIEACIRAGVRRYVHMSALGARPDATNRYHRSKWLAELAVRESGLDWTIFRPSLIHGPDGEFMRMMKYFCTAGLRQPVMLYFGRGETRLQPVYVRDVAACFVKCLAMPETVGQVYELGGPERLTWRQLYEVCSLSIIGRRKLKLPVHPAVARLLARTIVPLVPSMLMPYKFSVDQVLMSQEDNICAQETAEKVFDIHFADFREELARYADLIG
ncbi:MAG: complex I NDUFA9 subunit family protein [Phycisphaerales bacterium]|nr:complex I NDUFA9 subunit family protein [Phycisphaerales bacterium]